MMRSHLVALLCVSVATGAVAQEQIPVGARVTVVVAERQRQVATRFGRRMTIRGELTSRSADSLWIRPTPLTGVLSVPKSAVRRIYQSRGEPSRLKSMLADGVPFAVVSALEFVLLYNRYNDELGRGPLWGASSYGEAALQGAGLGFAFGGAIGLVFPVERWRRRSLDAQ